LPYQRLEIEDVPTNEELKESIGGFNEILNSLAIS
jgi:hypothetical protein